MYVTEKVLLKRSRETKFPGVHKERLCSPGPRRSYTFEPISNGAFLKKAGAKRDPRDPARAPEFACRARAKKEDNNRSKTVLARIKTIV